MRAWLSHPGRECEPWVLAVGTPRVALLPLVIMRSRGLRVLRLMGHGWSDYLGSVPGEVPQREEAECGSLLWRGETPKPPSLPSP